MCGRFSLAPEAGVLEELFPDLAVPAERIRRYNIAPTQAILGVTQGEDGRAYQSFRWGLVPWWAKDATAGRPMINARAETVATRPAFSAAFKHRRCLLVADGFYEWRKNPDGRGKTPYHIRMRTGRPFAFAGLWERWRAPGGEMLLSAAIITTVANTVMRDLHDRMPVILCPQDYSVWLDPTQQNAEALGPLMCPCADDLLEAWAVSPTVNSPGVDLPECLSPIPLCE